MFEKLTETLDGFLSMGIPFYDCKVMKNGECVYRHMNGFLDKEEGTVPNGTELYNMYSCSKLVTCTAALMLYEKGCFKLEDKLSEYLPCFSDMSVKTADGVKKCKSEITIGELFDMTAGFSYNLHSPELIRCREETDGRCETLKLMEYLSREPLLFEPGYRWEYSLCHDVLAALVEVVSGKRFGIFVKENIFDKLNMTHSTFMPEDVPMTELCPQYKYDTSSDSVVKTDGSCVYRMGSMYDSGGAGLVSTVDDYVTFIEAIRTYKLLKPETVKLMSTNRLTDEQRAMPTYWVGGKRGYGLGQQCPTEDNPRPDFGWGGAAGAHYFIDTVNGITAYLGVHVLGYERFQQTRTVISPLIQEILK